MKRKIGYIFLVLFFGSVLGSLISDMILFSLPDGVVRDFFTISKTFGWNPFTINLHLIQLTTGLVIDFNVSSLIGLFISWYFLRYFK
tara:strand:- start:202 stop:462 length:261 start_codon:yes stop_codon:yes gene_type:complete